MIWPHGPVCPCFGEAMSDWKLPFITGGVGATAKVDDDDTAGFPASTMLVMPPHNGMWSRSYATSLPETLSGG